jgi:flagellin
MGMAINTNVDALDALRNLNITAGKFSSSVQKLSSGLRINTAADDAAGYAISNKLQAQVTGLNQAQRNAQDGVSMVQTAAGGITEIQSMLQRIRELAVEAGNATVGSSDASSINTEIGALHDEINRLAGTTTFNGVALLTGTAAVSLTGGTATVGKALATSGAVISAISVAGAAAGTFTLTSGAGTLTLANGVGAGSISQTVTLADMPAGGNETFNFSQLGVSFTIAGPTGGNDVAAKIGADLTGLTAITTATGAAASVFQVGANANETVGVNFASATTTSLGLDTAITGFATAQGANWTSATIGQTPAVAALLTATDNAITALNTTAANLGAVQNRLTHTIASVGVASENLNASESRIKDLDVASEMVNFTKTQILQQAGTAILAQANSAPQSILTLLR